MATIVSIVRVILVDYAVTVLIEAPAKTPSRRQIVGSKRGAGYVLQKRTGNPAKPRGKKIGQKIRKGITQWKP